MDKEERERLRFLKLLKKECGYQLDLIKNYQAYLDEFYEKHKEKITEVESKILSNIKISEQILEGFDLVKFVDKDNQLMLSFEKDGKTVVFDIDSIKNIQENIRGRSEVIQLLIKFNKENKEHVAKDIRLEQKVIHEIESLQESEPRKLLGIFVTPSEKERIKRRYERALKSLQDKLKSILGQKEIDQYNVDILNGQIDDYRKINAFVKKLSPEQCEEIIQKYNEVNVLYKKNEVLYKKLESIESIKLTLKEFVERKTKNDAIIEMMPLLKILIVLQKELPEEERNMHLTNLLSHFDFGEYKDLIKTLLDSIEKDEFGYISRSALKKKEDDYLKKLKAEENQEESEKK